MSEDRDYETEAKAEGWVPIDAWKGDPEKHVDAETFVKRGEEILPIVNAKNRKLVEQVDALTRRVEEGLQANVEFKQFTDKAIARERREKEQAIAQLEAVRKKAIDDSDGEAFDKADKKLAELKAAPEQPKADEPSPVVQAWLTDNSWYNDDETLQAIADGLSGVLAKKRPDLVGKRAFLDELTKMVQEQVPHKFENPNRSRSSVEDATQKGGGNGKARTFENLPADAKAACERFEKQIPGYTKEAYLAEYQWD